MICIQNLKVFCARQKSKSETKLCHWWENILSLFSVRSLEQGVICGGSSLSQQPAGAFAGLIFIFALLFRANASGVRLLCRKRDLTGARCRWLHGLFSKGNRDLPALPVPGAGAELPGSCSRTAPPAVPRALGPRRTFWHSCVICEMDFPGLKDFRLIYLLIYLSAEE